MKNIKRVFEKLNESDEKNLMDGLTAIWLEENIPYFDEKDMLILVKRLFEYGYEVYGIECFSREDFGYFRTYVQRLYIQKFGFDTNSWHLEAFTRLLTDYKSIVQKLEPLNPPVFNVTFGHFE